MYRNRSRSDEKWVCTACGATLSHAEEANLANKLHLLGPYGPWFPSTFSRLRCTCTTPTHTSPSLFQCDYPGKPHEEYMHSGTSIVSSVQGRKAAQKSSSSPSISKSLIASAARCNSSNPVKRSRYAASAHASQMNWCPWVRYASTT